MSALDDLKGKFFKFRRRKYALLVGLVLTIVLCALFLTYAYGICFSYVIVALMGYYIPWFFGLKDRRKLAVFGVVLLVVISIPFGLNLANTVSSSGDEKLSSSDGVLINGTVTPFQSDSATTHHFSVVVTDASVTNVSFLVQDTWAASDMINITSNNSTPVAGGRLFTQDITLVNSSLYAYQFGAANATKWTLTDAVYGPVDVSQGTLQAHWLQVALFQTFFVVGLLFFLLLILTWFSDRSKKKAQEMSAKMEESRVSKKLPEPSKEEGKPDKLVCSECGAEVPADAKECPKCGEKFDDEGGDFLCTECGAKVKEDDKKCWNCGKEFEN